MKNDAWVGIAPTLVQVIANLKIKKGLILFIFDLFFSPYLFLSL